MSRLATFTLLLVAAFRGLRPASLRLRFRIADSVSGCGCLEDAGGGGKLVHGLIAGPD